MNLLLFEQKADQYFLSNQDPRARHIKSVLRLHRGDPIYVGVVNGPRGLATLEASTPEGLTFSVSWESVQFPLMPLSLLIGLPRPQTAKKILQECTSLGVSDITFFQAEKSEPSYASSALWKDCAWKKHLILGAEQAFAPSIPQVHLRDSLQSALGAISHPATLWALDNYEASSPLSRASASTNAIALAIGPERGWSSTERTFLRSSDFELLSLGSRILRSETACIAATSLIAQKLGFL